MGQELEKPSAAPKKVSEILNECWPYYFSIGMSYQDYWLDDPHKVDLFVKAYKIKQKQKNYDLWLQGLYNFIALQSAIASIFAKKGSKPKPYIEKPLPTDEAELKEMQEKEIEKRVVNFKNYLVKIAKKKGGNKNG